MNIFAKIALSVAFLLAAQHIVKIIYLMGFHIQLYNHYPGVCHQVDGVDFGSEHMFMTPKGLVFITSGFRIQSSSPSYVKYLKDNNVKGRVLLFNFKNPAKTAAVLKISSTKDFKVDTFVPHGISGWIDASGTVFLFVVNHGYDYDRIEKFQYLPDKQELKHVKYYAHPVFRIMNDVAATGEDSFYFTNYQLSSSALKNILQTMLFLRWLDVGHCQGTMCQSLASGFINANGIAISPDKKFVYVADSFGKEMAVFDRMPNNSLVLKHVYPLYTHLDNIHVDEATGDLYLGCHPIAHEIMKNLEEPGSQHKSTSQVLQLKMKDGNVVATREIFVDDGTMISGSAIAVLYQKKMLIGSVMDKLVYCDITVPL